MLKTFGNQGELPSHPELLDWLVGLLYREPMGCKSALIKKIAMSATYRQSAAITLEKQRLDPENILLSTRALPSRLEAEMMRDQALAASVVY